MNNDFVPPSISLLQIISSQLNEITPLFRPDNIAFQDFQTLINTHNFLAENEVFFSDQMRIIYIQLLILLTLSLGKNLNIPFIKYISQKESSIDILWENNISNSFVLGKFDKDFQDFFAFTMWKQFLIRESAKKFPKSIIYTIKDELRNHIVDLEFTKKQINFILDQKENLEFLINSEKLAPIMYFIILAAMPQAELNAFFLSIQSYFPEDLIIKNKNGNNINITSFFETGSTDINFLLEKVKVYFDLYKKSDMPIIQNITQMKSKTLLLEVLKNTNTKKEIHANLEKMLTDQIILRIFLYSIFMHHLEVTLES
jgi:hypothetical protein